MLSYRTACVGDALAASRIITAALDDLAARQGRPPLRAPDGHAAPVLAHIIETDGARVWLCVDGGRPVGFGAGWARGALSFCGGLFVLPEWQGKGVGRRLFELAMGEMPAADGVAALTSSAANPVSNGLYARHGIYPMFALLTMTGPRPRLGESAPSGDLAARQAAAVDGLAHTAGELSRRPLTESDLGALRGVDEAVLGVNRTVDHRWYLSRHTGWLFRRDQRVAGYAYLGGDETESDGAIGPVAALSAEDQPEILRSVVAGLAELGTPRATVMVPGPNVVVQRVLWRAGFSFSGASGLLCASRPFGRFDRYLLAGDAIL